jgi:hypothetical protein
LPFVVGETRGQQFLREELSPERGVVHRSGHPGAAMTALPPGGGKEAAMDREAPRTHRSDDRARPRHPMRRKTDRVNIEHVLAGGGEMGALMRSIDWTRTALGPVEGWPQSLRTTVSTCLNSRFPIVVWWGAEMVKIYNDGYREFLGAKHPRAMGARGREVWPEIWDIIGPMLEGVLSEGKATWSENQFLLLERHGYPEECYFTFSYSPIRDESGGIGGIYCAVTETTRQILSERRLRTLRDLGAQTAGARVAKEACRRAAEVLAGNPSDLPFAMVYLLEGDGTEAHLSGAAGIEGGQPASPDVIRLDDATARWPIGRAVATNEVVRVDDVQHRCGPFRLASGLTPRTALVLPVAPPGEAPPRRSWWLVSARAWRSTRGTGASCSSWPPTWAPRSPPRAPSRRRNAGPTLSPSSIARRPSSSAMSATSSGRR